MGKLYRVTLNVRLNEVKLDLVPMGPGQVQKVERVVLVQVTEAAGEGESPKAALEDSMANGFSAYLEGLASAEEVGRVLLPGRESEH